MYTHPYIITNVCHVKVYKEKFYSDFLRQIRLEHNTELRNT